MTKAPIALQELRRRIYRKAKSEKAHRFWGIFVHVTRTETLEEAYRIAKRNSGAAGIDGQTFATIETAGLECFLAGNCPGWGLGSEQAEGIRQGCRIAGQGVDDGPALLLGG